MGRSSAAVVANVAFGASTAGVTFEWDASGASLGLSVVGEHGAKLSSYGGVGSPGTIGVPEPETALLGLAALGRLFIRRRR